MPPVTAAPPLARALAALRHVIPAFALATGGSVLLGWWLRVPALVQLAPDIVPVQPNTALCMLLLGLAMLRGVPLAAALGCAAAALAVATLSGFQYVAQVDLRIDDFVAEPWVAVGSSHPGRMAPNSSLAIGMTAVAAALHRARAGTSGYEAVAMMLAAGVVAVAGVALVSYATHFEAGYSWGVLTRMAPQTATVLLALGAQLLVEAHWRAGAGARRSRAVSLAVGLGGLVIAALVWQALGIAERRALDQVIDTEVRALGATLERELEQRFDVPRRVAARWERNGGRTREEFELEAEVNLQQDPSFRVIGWIDPQHVIRWVHPLRGNEPAIDFAFGREPQRRAALATAREQRRLAVTRPVELVQGGLGFLAVVPVTVDGASQGYVYAGFDAHGVMAGILGNEAPGYGLRVTAGGREVYARGGGAPRIAPRQVVVSAGGTEWTVEAWPRYALVAGTPLPEVVFVVSALLAILLGIAMQASLLARLRAERLAGEIDARARAEAETRSSEERFRLVVENSPSAMVMTDARGHIVLVNAQTERLFGWSRAELLGEPVDRLLPHELAAEHARQRARYFQDARPRPMGAGRELRARRRDGSEFAVEIGLSPVPMPGVTLVLATILDVTARQRAEAEVRQLNATLEDRVARRTAELEELNAQLEAFTYSVSHDLRSPLRSMQGFADALREDHAAKLDGEALHFLERIVAASQRMERLIEDLLAYSRLSREELAPGPVPLETAVDQALQQLESDLARSGALVHVNRPLPPVLAHRATLVQMLQNLVGNAAKFVARDARPEIVIEAEPRGSRVRIVVADNGIGVPERHRERIFRVFERLHGNASYGGTGIGLAIVRKGAARMGGDCGVEPNAAGGSRFWIELPGAPGQALSGG